jgi:hypothetical protein
MHDAGGKNGLHSKIDNEASRFKEGCLTIGNCQLKTVNCSSTSNPVPSADFPLTAFPHCIRILLRQGGSRMMENKQGNSLTVNKYEPWRREMPAGFHFR